MLTLNKVYTNLLRASFSLSLIKISRLAGQDLFVACKYLRIYTKYYTNYIYYPNCNYVVGIS